MSREWQIHVRIILSCMVLGVKVLVFTNAAQGDGLLSQIREKAVGEENREEHRNKKGRDEDHSDNGKGTLQQVLDQVTGERDGNDQHGEHRRRRNRRAGIRPPVHNVSFVTCGQPVYAYEPSTSYVYVSQSIISEQPRDVYESVVCEPRPLDLPPSVPVTYESAAIADHDWFTQWCARLTAVGGGNFDDISNFGLALLLQRAGGLGIDTSVQTLRENGMSFRDHLWLGDVNFMFEPISTNNLRGRIGIGVNWLGDNLGGEAGFNLTGGFDLKLNDRWLLVGEGDIGTLGDSDFSHGEISLVRRFGKAGIAIGYESYDIGGVVIDSFFTGLEFRF